MAFAQGRIFMPTEPSWRSSLETSLRIVGWRSRVSRCHKPVEVAVELSVSDRPFVWWIEANGQGPTEPDGGEGDVGRRDAIFDSPVASSTFDEPGEHIARRGLLIGPERRIEQRADDVDHAEAGVDSGVHVLAQCLATGG